MTHGACLSGDTAALGRDEHVILAEEVGHCERLIDVSAERFAGNVARDVNAIDGPFAVACDQTDVCNSGFTAAGALGEFVSHVRNPFEDNQMLSGSGF